MTPEERSHIVNAIWLCRSCGKLIDSDQHRFTVDVLYRWKREHEATVTEAIGAPDGRVERRLQIEDAFRGETAAALQIALDEPQHWQPLLMSELLRRRLKQTRTELNDLDADVVYLPLTRVGVRDSFSWFADRCGELARLAAVLGKIVTEVLPRVVNEAEQPEDLLRCADLLGSACQGAPQWERTLRASSVPDELEETCLRMRGWTRQMFEEMEKISDELLVPVREEAKGTHMIELQFVEPSELQSVAREFARIATALVEAE